MIASLKKFNGAARRAQLHTKTPCGYIQNTDFGSDSLMVTSIGEILTIGKLGTVAHNALWMYRKYKIGHRFACGDFADG